MHPRVLWGQLTSLLAVIFKRLHRSGVFTDEKGKCRVYLQEGQEEKGLGSYRLVSLHSVPGKVMKKVLLEAISKHTKNTEVIRSNQYRFTNDNDSCLLIFIAFYDEVTATVDKRVLVNVVYLDFSNAFDRVSHILLMTKLEKYRLEK